MTRSIEPRRVGQHHERNGTVQRQRTLSLGLVDTVPLFRDGITALVDKTPWMSFTAHAASRQGAAHMAEQVKPDVILLDSGLDPNCQLTQQLVTANPSLRVVLLIRDAERTSGYLAAAMAAGAHGATPRCVEPHRVLEAIKHATRARRYLDPALAALITQAHDRETATVSAPPATATAEQSRVRLSRRELQVLQLVAEGLENAAIAKVLFLSVETVRTHVKSILRKLSARDRTHAVTIAFRTGLLALTPPENEPAVKRAGVTPAEQCATGATGATGIPVRLAASGA
ncbi:response regulator transcription factor [Haloechinothrix sp. LS1_15]|uniref:response regulator transcription factor n=1 Tax=Haloechinothrix sp. LS1_15 TaxID=2652248 RepID=UPI002944ECA5|nr:response regulator transcription factor [Haloechinothrix sp. LS1_15]MDV6011101.1 response regulator transcription factor [Haloechinothrix sp. LS1_15]